MMIENSLPSDADALPAGGDAPGATFVPPDAEEFGKTVLNNVFELWFTPEIERRRADGLIGEDFVLLMAQAIFPEDAPNEIRLNDEVRGVMLIEAQRPVEKGEQVLLTDLADPRAFELIDEELDCGHFTIIRRGPGNDWMLTFNALAGRAKAANFVRLASDFLKAAVYARDEVLSGPCLDNLFSCCELLAKAELVMHRSHATKSKKHGAISSAINQWGKLGNVHPLFVSLLNSLSNMRSAARYEGTTGAQHLPSDEEMGTVAAYLAYLEERSSPKIDGNASFPGTSEQEARGQS
jgi:hypothetical protein